MPHTASPPDGIAVVTIDRLPAWMLPAYGAAWVAMPNLDGLAGRGLVLDRVIATSDDPTAMLASLGATNPAASNGARWPVFMQALAAGWNTALVTDDDAVATSANASIDAILVPSVESTEPAPDESGTNLGRLFAVAADTVTAGPHQLVWCHASSLGIAWDAPVGYRDRYIDPEDPPPPSGASVPELMVGPETDPDVVVGLRHVFAGQLTLLDRCIGNLVEAIARRRGRWTILIAGVRGMGLGLHGVVGCGPLPPYGELVHLPSILVDHRERMAGQRYGGLVIPADFGATLIDMLGYRHSPVADSCQGRSLIGLLDDWRGPDRNRVVTLGTLGTAIATPAWNLVLPSIEGATEPRGRLFAKPDDYFEVCDVADRCPAIAEELSVLAGGDPQLAWTTKLSSAAENGV